VDVIKLTQLYHFQRSTLCKTSISCFDCTTYYHTTETTTLTFYSVKTVSNSSFKTLKSKIQNEDVMHFQRLFESGGNV